MSISKQCVGIDISHKTFTACICSKDLSNELLYTKVKHFKNEKNGFNQLLRWVGKQKETSSELVFLMEATGVYYEALAYYLYKIKKTVHVVLPNTSKHYFCSLNIKSKTDEIDAKVLSRFGVERQHKVWKAPSPLLQELRNLTRYYVQLQETKTSLSNVLHSKEAAYDVQQFILKSNKKLINQLDKQIEGLKTKMDQIIKSDRELKQRVDNLLTIKGIGILTIATIIAETNGFEEFNNIKQLVSYAGYDVVERQSGTSVKGQARISKKGNRYIRNALYFPAMVACRYNQELKTSYLRIIQKKPSKMIGQVAIQRKLLVLVYTLWKKNQPFIQGYKQSSSNHEIEAALDSSLKELL